MKDVHLHSRRGARRSMRHLRDGGLAGTAVHEPWTLPGGPPEGYAPPIVDHAAERTQALRRYAAAKD